MGTPTQTGARCLRAGSLYESSQFPISLPRRVIALAPGVRLGACEVTAQIGVGGMGEVYRAR